MSVLDLSGLVDGQVAHASDVSTNLLALLAISLPIGGMVDYAGAGDPAGGIFLLADGRLVDKTTYSDFFALVGHAYNGGVDPGSNKVRLPDRRGRVGVGPDDMGTAQGAASRIVTAAHTLGGHGGEEKHTQTTGEIGAHSHPVDHSNGTQIVVFVGAAPAAYADTTPTTQGVGAADLSTESVGSSTPFNVMQPFEVSNVIVRVL